MIDLLHQVNPNSSQQLDTIIVIGAGNGSSLATLRKLNGKRLILVEGHPRQVEILNRRVRTNLNEAVYPIVISTESAAAALIHPCNNPNFSSIVPPGQLLEKAPNLRFDEPISVPAQGINKFFGSLQLDTINNNLLILDTPGISFQLLVAAPPDLLQTFSAIIVRDTEKAGLYEGARAIREAVNHLESIGFDNSHTDTKTLFPQAAHLLKRHPERLARYACEQQLIKVKQENEKLSSIIARLKQHNTTLDNERDTLIQEKEALFRKKAILQQTQEKQKKQLEALNFQINAITEKNNALAKENDKIKHTVDEQNAVIEKLSDARNTAQRQCKEKEKYSDQLEAKVKEQEQRQQEQLEALNFQINAITEKNNALAKENDKIKHTVDEQNTMIEKLSDARNTAQRQCKEKEKYSDQLETKVKEQEQRQQLLEEELVKAEAQIELIKDLWLQESGL